MAEQSAATPLVEPVDWKKRIVVGGLLVVGGFLAYLIGAAVIPRWWAQRIGDFVDGRISVGSTLGVFLGLLFTVLPLLVIGAAFRWRAGWKRALGFLIAALLLATPNLMTLGIVLGDGSAAHAGERILDVDGPGFRGGTLVGAVLGVVIVGAVAYLVVSRRRSRRQVSRLREEHERQSAAAAPRDDQVSRLREEHERQSATPPSPAPPPPPAPAPPTEP